MRKVFLAMIQKNEEGINLHLTNYLVSSYSVMPAIQDSLWNPAAMQKMRITSTIYHHRSPGAHTRLKRTVRVDQNTLLKRPRPQDTRPHAGNNERCSQKVLTMAAFVHQASWLLKLWIGNFRDRPKTKRPANSTCPSAQMTDS